MTTNSTLDKKSRYVGGGVTENEPNGLGWWERRQWEFSQDDELIVVSQKYEHRIDLLASDYLNDSHLWWVIAQYNAILDPYAEIVQGTYLRIPPASKVQDMISGRTGGVTSQRQEHPSQIKPIF